MSTIIRDYSWIELDDTVCMLHRAPAESTCHMHVTYMFQINLPKAFHAQGNRGCCTCFVAEQFCIFFLNLTTLDIIFIFIQEFILVLNLLDM